MGFWNLFSRKRISSSVAPKEDRRGSCRYPALTRECTLGWKVDGSMIEIPVYLENLSTGGCRVSSSRPLDPSPGEPIWFKTASVNPFHWIAGTLISTHSFLVGKLIIKIQFIDPLPYETFKFLIYGPDDTRGPRRRGSIPSHETDKFWR
jgi:hypothetical protein